MHRRSAVDRAGDRARRRTCDEAEDRRCGIFRPEVVAVTTVPAMIAGLVPPIAVVPPIIAIIVPPAATIVLNVAVLIVEPVIALGGCRRRHETCADRKTGNRSPKVFFILLAPVVQGSAARTLFDTRALHRRPPSRANAPSVMVPNLPRRNLAVSAKRLSQGARPRVKLAGCQESGSPAKIELLPPVILEISLWFRSSRLRLVQRISDRDARLKTGDGVQSCRTAGDDRKAASDDDPFAQLQRMAI